MYRSILPPAALRGGFFILAASIPLVIALSCSRPQGVSGATAWDPAQAAESTAVDAVTVAAGSLVTEVWASGTVAGVNEAYAVSETSGLIRTARFSIGDSVEAGQALLSVDDAILKLDLDRARAQWDAARIEAEAAEKLVQSGGSSAVALARAKSAESGAKAQYETARKRYEDAVVRSPIKGVVASKEAVATVGNSLAPGSRIARIVDVSSFRLTVAVGEREVGLIEPGALVRVSVPAALGEETVEGRVEAVAAGSDPATGSFPVVVSFRNGFGGRIKSGMTASAAIAVRSAVPALVIPSAALVRRGDRYAAFVEEGGSAAVRELVLGNRVGPRVEVLSGLTVGDVLILSGLTRLRSGSPVAVSLRGDSLGWE